MWGTGLELDPRRDPRHGSLEWSAQGTDGRYHDEVEGSSLYILPSLGFEEVAACLWVEVGSAGETEAGVVFGPSASLEALVALVSRHHAGSSYCIRSASLSPLL